MLKRKVLIHFLKLFKEATFLISAGTLLTLFHSAGAAAAAAKERAPSVGSIFVVGGSNRARGGALGYFLGGYVPLGTPNWHPVLKKIHLKLIPRSRNGPVFYTPF